MSNLTLIYSKQNKQNNPRHNLPIKLLPCKEPNVLGLRYLEWEFSRIQIFGKEQTIVQFEETAITHREDGEEHTNQGKHLDTNHRHPSIEVRTSYQSRSELRTEKDNDEKLGMLSEGRKT